MAQVTLAEKIRYLRKSRGMSQIELARRLGLRNNSFISHLERGSKRPSIHLLRRIAELFSYDYDSLLALAGAPRTERPGDQQQELKPTAGADLLARLRQEVYLFGERMNEEIGESLPDFLWDREYRLIVEARAREVWLVCPRICHHGVAEDLLRVASNNLGRGVPYRYLLPDTKEMRVEAGRMLKRYQGLPDEEARLELRFVKQERFPFVLELALFDPQDPARAQGTLTPPSSNPAWEVALRGPHALDYAAIVARAWDENGGRSSR
ncbi:MAG: helix-turn-helix transcriptional regulator [Candidatus Eiseniibacteriota bacterium]|jgi:transcriptional regulator with XRE-family HTH domain